MSFGLHNAGATFQRLMHIALGRQLGRNAEAYVEDIVVKSRESRTLIKDLEETFANLRKVNLRLNPEKCVFGVPSGKLLGFLVSHRGIEANPEKCVFGVPSDKLLGFLISHRGIQANQEKVKAIEG